MFFITLVPESIRGQRTLCEPDFSLPLCGRIGLVGSTIYLLSHPTAQLRWGGGVLAVFVLFYFLWYWGLNLGPHS